MHKRPPLGSAGLGKERRNSAEGRQRRIGFRGHRCTCGAHPSGDPDGSDAKVAGAQDIGFVAVADHHHPTWFHMEMFDRGPENAWIGLAPPCTRPMSGPIRSSLAAAPDREAPGRSSGPDPFQTAPNSGIRCRAEFPESGRRPAPPSSCVALPHTWRARARVDGGVGNVRRMGCQ